MEIFNKIQGLSLTPTTVFQQFFLNRMCAQNYMNINVLPAYNSIKKFDALCKSETYIDSSSSSDDKSLEISSYILIRADHPFNSKTGGVCIFITYKNV